MGGTVIHSGAVVTDFRSSDGHVLWRRTLASSVRANPTIDPGTAELFVSDRIASQGIARAVQFAFSMVRLRGSTTFLASRIRPRSLRTDTSILG